MSKKSCSPGREIWTGSYWSPDVKNVLFFLILLFTIIIQYRGIARIFQRGGGHTVSNIIVMAFSPRNIIGCFLKKRLTKGGVTGTPGPPLATPLQYLTHT